MKKIFTICLMVLAVLGCEDMNQGTQGENGNEPENEGTETLELPTLWESVKIVSLYLIRTT